MNVSLSVLPMPSGMARQLGLYELRAWVLMVNHVHILIYPEAKLSRITKSIKNFSARKANSILGLTGQEFWQDESYDHWVRGPEELLPKIGGLLKRRRC
jgi:REP element-mobilizing transposase RayT